MKKLSIRLWIVLLLCFTGCGITEKDSNGTEPVSPVPTVSASELFQKEEAPKQVRLDSADILGETLEKVDATEQAAYNAANRMLKHVWEHNQNSLFCIDEDSGVIYFVNQKQDYYIYRLKDGVAELVVPIPAKELYCRDGVLYFMVEDYGEYELQGMKRWDIYAYCPAEGTVKPIYALGEVMEQIDETLATQMQRMTVDEQGIYFLGKMEKNTKEFNGAVYNVTEKESCYLPFGATEPVVDEKDMTVAGWGDYSFCYYGLPGNIRLALFHRVTQAVEDMIIVSGKAYQYCCMGDVVYTIEGKKVVTIDLITMERTEYDSAPIIREKAPRLINRDGQTPDLRAFTITEDSFWTFCQANCMVRFDRSSKEAFFYELDAELVDEAVYTDGTSVYVLTSEGVARLLTEEVKESADGNPVLGVELLVK